MLMIEFFVSMTISFLTLRTIDRSEWQFCSDFFLAFLPMIDVSVTVSVLFLSQSVYSLFFPSHLTDVFVRSLGDKKEPFSVAISKCLSSCSTLKTFSKKKNICKIVYFFCFEGKERKAFKSEDAEWTRNLNDNEL